ncbi:hypothetical protein [Agrobacterium tumefaciens]|uniref:hypothetical protein n=1 Tax=Agrobacterium tumefaciens TaxID=358 RepID=UPI003B9E1BCF
MSASEATKKIIDVFKALDGFEPDTENDYSQSDDVFGRNVSGQYAVMRPKGANGSYLSRMDVLAVAEEQTIRFSEIEEALSDAVALSKRLQNELTHSEKVYRANAESYRAEISELRSTNPPALSE